MNKEILKHNIEEAILQPYLSNPWLSTSRDLVSSGLSENKKYIMISVSTDDSSWQCDLVDKDGNPIDYVGHILEQLPEKYRDHLVTIKHDGWISYSYEPVFDTDTQAMWNNEMETFYRAKQAWCDRYGCD